MSSEQLIGLGLALAVMFIGLLGCLLPVLPSTPIVLAAAVAHRLYFGHASASTPVLLVLGAITVLSLVLDFLASMVGAKKLGATWLGVFGALLGAFVGLFFSLPGIILGPFLGALLFELIGGKNFTESTKAGTGALIGLIFGALGKVVCCFVMMALFTMSVVHRSGSLTNTAGVLVDATRVLNSGQQRSSAGSLVDANSHASSAAGFLLFHFQRKPLA